MAVSRFTSSAVALALAASVVAPVPARAQVISDTASATVHTTFTQWQNDRDNARAALDGATADADQARADLATAEESLANARAELDTAEERVRAAEQAVAKQQRDNQSAFEAELTRLREEHAAATTEKAEAEAQLARAEAVLRDAADAAAAAREEKARQESAVAEFDRQLDELAGTIIGKGNERDAQSAWQTFFANHQFTQIEYQRLCAQAILEMVNEYRIANGLAPLRTHVRYNVQAEGYSREMSRLDIFEHSDKQKWGYSGENIALLGYYDPESMTSDDWGKLAERFFNGWRNSPGHNQNMLESIFQGIGMGVDIDQKGAFRATTMFFIEDTKLTNGSFYNQSPATTTALRSEYPHYYASGAKELLGLGDWTAPRDPNGAMVDNAKILGGKAAQMRKVQGLNTDFDRRVDMSHAANPAKAAEYGARVDRLNGEIGSLSRGYADLLAERETAQQRLDTATEHERETATGVERANTELAQARSSVEASITRLNRADTASQNAPSAPNPVAPALFDERDAARDALPGARDAVEAARQTVEEKTAVFSDAETAQAEALEAFNAITANEPQRPSPTTPTSPTNPQPDNNPSGSSVGTVIGVIVAVLAVLGLLAVLSGQLSIQF